MNYNSLRVKDGSIDTIPRLEISKEEVEAATQKVNELQMKKQDLIYMEF